MSSYDEGLRRIAQYRLCLERDVDRGIIRAEAAEAIDRCFVSLAGCLESARVAIEGAGAVPEEGFAGHFAAACGDLARQLFVAMYREPDPRRLAGVAASLKGEALGLVEHLWLRLDHAA
jgi:hypothetical protein